MKTNNLFCVSTFIKVEKNAHLKFHAVLLFLIFFFYGNNILAQEKINNDLEKFKLKYFLDAKNYNYSKTSDEALSELKSLVLNDEVRFNSIKEKIIELESKQIYFLSTEEYKPIKDKIESIRNCQNLQKEEYDLLKNHIKYLDFHFKSIKELTR